MVDAREARTHAPPSVRERRVAALMGLWAVVAAAAVVAVAAIVIFVHRPHTPELTPGQKQPAALSLFGAFS